ncbi:PRTRC system protein A [Noviherbaspirillum suwonense]|uniref:PRTRC system protein A n=1 Tax=Noviherbaspirillum suwonense TaxID=1224511 RepID=A0ABY1QWD8_9BURK|nr:PRTRC system protein A [Noviherbaspirillum suwonense]SMP80777.1 PRTRC system protein A [Noviherbaspirillum suwonense]
MLNRIDAVLQSATPTVMVPRHEPFVPMAQYGHRFLAASDGLWLEARRAWLYLRWNLAKQAQVAMPYGAVEPVVQVQKVPGRLVEEFISFARDVCPLECAAWIIWNDETDQCKLVKMVPTSVSSASVAFNRPALGDNEHLVVDLHSHGRLPAFFTSEDNRDDRGEFKVAGVFGKLDGDIECRFRLCANGLYIDMGNKWEGQ